MSRFKTERTIKISPSLLSGDFAYLGTAALQAEEGGADLVHVDIMDGHFVPNITIGPASVAALKRVTAIPLEVHLMIENPERYLERFADAGADYILVHAETVADSARVVDKIRELGARPGLVINPATPMDGILNVLSTIDMLLLMTVNPGFAGQAFMEEVLPKIAQARTFADTHELTLDIEVDGGIALKTAGRVVEAGANVLAAGSAIYNTGDVAGAIRDLRREAEEALK